MSDPLAWQDHGACRTADVNLFFPERGNATTAVRAAKAICATCPVLDDCKMFGLANRERHGIWGGLTEDERRIYLRTHQVPRIKKVAPCGTMGGYRRHRANGETPCPACQWAGNEDHRIRGYDRGRHDQKVSA